MTALWTVTVLAAALSIIESVAVIGLIRQVGLLHLRIETPREARPAPGQHPSRGPQPGSRLRLDPVRDALGDGPAPGLVLLGFVRPTCSSCTAVLPVFTAAAAGLAPSEQAVLVSDADEAGTRAYLAAHAVSLPLITGPHLLSVNGIPTIPYAVVLDGAGNVLAAGSAASAEHLGAVLRRARSGTRLTAAQTVEAGGEYPVAKGTPLL